MGVSSATDQVDQNSTNSYYSSLDDYEDYTNNQDNRNTETSSKIISLDSNNFDNYVTNGKFNNEINDGDTIDIQDKLDDSRFALEIDKPINIISSNGEGYIDFNTSHSGKIFRISKSGSGSNITGIIIHNTRFSVENTSNVHINNISCLDEGANIGNGVGSFTVREGSENITITNSYFKAKDNGGHSNVVFAAAYNCLFENNTVENYGNNALVGNTLYLTTYNVEKANPKTNINITIRNNTIRSYLTLSMATCWGLVLEGKGHLIENNYIAAGNAVVSQYADSDYDFETVIDGITFRNNYIEYGGPQFYFPGEVYNNTINGFANFGNIKAYNNTLDKVIIQSNTMFENNTAKKINITGKNNKINNNEVYSNEEYAVTVLGENNTLTNNKFASVNGRGEKAIINSSNFTSINNSEDISRVIVIDDSGYDSYIEEYYLPNNFRIKFGLLHDNDLIIINTTKFNNNILRVYDLPENSSINVIVADNTMLSGVYSYNGTNLVLINSSLPGIRLGPSEGGNLTLINSLVGQTIGTTLNINSTILSEYPKEGIYILTCQNPPGGTSGYIARKTYNGILQSEILAGSTIWVHIYDTTVSTKFTYPNLFLDRTLIFEAIPHYGIMKTHVYFNEGSTGSIMRGITFNDDVTINEHSISFFNCTFNGNVEVNNMNAIFENNIFNGKITLNSADGSILNNNTIRSNESINISNSKLSLIENNTITTTADNTIIFDDESRVNRVKNNILTASTLLGDDTVVGGDNTVEDNGPSYNTSIEITTDDIFFKNDISNINITVYNLLNNTSVDKGYVEVYLDGVLQGNMTLVNGQVTLEVNTNKSSFGIVPLKVWYYEGIRYTNNVTSINVDVVKSNVSISVDEFTAKLNEKATVTTTFINQEGNPVSDTNVTFIVGRSSFTVETVDGVATLDEMVTKEWLDAAKITVSFPSTDAYNSNSTTITLNTSKADVLMVPMVSVDGNVADVELTLSDALGENVSDGRIVLSTLDGQELASGRVSNGKFSSSVALPEGYSEEYLVANFTGSYYYNDFVRNVKITQMLNSTISLNTNSPLYGEELVITGRLVDSKNNPIGGANLTLNLNGSKVIVTTNDVGEYNYTYTPGLGVNSLTVTFDGTVDVYGSSASKDVTIRDTDREMNEVLNRLDDLQKENDKLREQLEQLQEQNNKTNEQLDNITQANNELKEQLDNLTKDNNDLSKQLNDTKNNLTQQNNDLQEQNKELNDKLDNTAKNLTDANKALQEQNNDAQKQLDSLSKANGELKEQLTNTTEDLIDSNNDLKEQNKALQDQNKQLNDKLDAIFKQLEDSVAKNTVITINNVPSARFGQNVTITGKLSDCDGNVIASSPVSVNVGGIAQKVTTDKNGVYTLTVKASVVGDNSVVVSFDANNKYNYAENTTTFKVTRQNLVLKLDSIKAVYYGDKVQITGVLSDANGKLIVNTLLNLDINGKTVKVKTVAGGKFTYTVAAKTVGTNNVTVSYKGNKNYNSVSAKKTFKVYKQGLKITVNKITSTKYKNTVKVTGKLTDANGKVIMNTLVNININGKAYTAKTNNKGVYTLTLKATTLGVNNVTVSYKGNKNYKKATVKTTFRVAKQNVKVTLTTSKYENAKATITGKLVDANNKVLMNSNVKITINNKTYNAKTNTEGTYTITKPVTSKKITLTLAYNGNKNYNAYKKTSNVTLA